MVTFVCLLASVSSCVSATHVFMRKCNHTGYLYGFSPLLVRHHVNLQCVGESGGHVIVLFAAVWLFSNMFPNHVPS